MTAPTNQPRLKWNSYLAPVFLIFILLAFFVFPGSTLDKFNMICFGI
jgi:hypothetical protein